MKRLLASIVLWAALLGAGSPLLACATAAAGGDCCPPGAPSECTQVYEYLEAATTAHCLTSGGSSRIVFAEHDRGPQSLEDDGGSADPVVIAGAFSLLLDDGMSSGIDAAIVGSILIDRSLTYLHTGRLRL